MQERKLRVIWKYEHYGDWRDMSEELSKELIDAYAKWRWHNIENDMYHYYYISKNKKGIAFYGVNFYCMF